MHHLNSSVHAPLHFVAVVARAAFFPCFFDDRRTQGESILCSVLSPPLPFRRRCLRSLLGHLRPWGVVVVEADVGRALLCLFASVFSERKHPFLAFSGPFPRVTDLHRSVTPWDCLFHRSQLYFLCLSMMHIHFPSMRSGRECASSFRAFCDGCA